MINGDQIEIPSRTVPTTVSPEETIQMNDVCHPHNPCWNNGTCHKAQKPEDGFICRCPFGLTGTLCQLPLPKICVDGSISNCIEGFCSVTSQGENRCICPIGRDGNLCQNQLELEESAIGIDFNGQTSFIAILGDMMTQTEKPSDAEGPYHGQNGFSVGFLIS